MKINFSASRFMKKVFHEFASHFYEGRVNFKSGSLELVLLLDMLLKSLIVDYVKNMEKFRCGEV